MWMNGYGADWHWLGWLSMAFFALIPILLVFALIKYLLGGRRANAAGNPRKSDARATLEQRYARGEIEREEYLQKREDIG